MTVFLVILTMIILWLILGQCWLHADEVAVYSFMQNLNTAFLIYMSKKAHRTGKRSITITYTPTPLYELSLSQCPPYIIHISSFLPLNSKSIMKIDEKLLDLITSVFELIVTLLIPTR